MKLFEALITKQAGKKAPLKIYLVTKKTCDEQLAALPEAARAWAKISKFTGASGQLLKIPDDDGALSSVLLGLGEGEGADLFQTGKLNSALSDQIIEFHPSDGSLDLSLPTLGFLLGGYQFSGYKTGKKDKPKTAKLLVHQSVDHKQLLSIAEAVYMGRDLINRTANDLTTSVFESKVLKFAEDFKMTAKVTKGKRLEETFPLIWAVGKGAEHAPRLVDLTWGKKSDPKITLVGKGLCFDTGGLNLKPGSSMNLMKKDMGGAAAALTLARMIVEAKLPINLRVLLPIAENAIDGHSFRPADILNSYKGDTVEIYNTDAEGRLVLADALALGGEDKPDLMLSFATLTGAARVATGPDLPPFYVDDEDLAKQVQDKSFETLDPIWRMPFWPRYKKYIESNLADIKHCAETGFAGSITAALFLKHFAGGAKTYMHFDIYGWVPSSLPGKPKGGEPQAARAMFEVIKERYGD